MRARHLPLLVLAALTLPTAAAAQRGGVGFDISLGAFRHQSDLHTYFATRFDDATSLGAGISFPLRRSALARVGVDHVSTQLSGGPVWTEAAATPDRILSAELQLLGLAGNVGRVQPFAGAGVGLRRYTVNTWILSDDIIDRPWQDPQVQPALSALAGLRVGLAGSLGAAAEVKWSRARFRAGDDTWGLPEDPVQWQTEFRPGVRLEWSGRAR
jgi:hypothetical protein